MSWGGKKEITEIVLLSAANKKQKKNPTESTKALYEYAFWVIVPK